MNESVKAEIRELLHDYPVWRPVQARDALEKALNVILELEEQTKVHTGYWKEDKNGIYTPNHDVWECSECGHAQILIEGTPKENDYKYCPCCGAQMEGK